MFSKFKNFLYSLNGFRGKFFQLLFAFLFTVRRFVGKSTNVKNFGIIEVVTLLPCFIYISPLFGGQALSEDLKGFQMVVDVTKPQEFAKVVGASNSTDVSVVFQKAELRDKSILECFGGFIESLSFFEFPGDNAGEKGSEQGGENNETEDFIYHIPTILCCIWLFIHVIISTQLLG